MNPLYEANRVLGFYCDNLVLMLEQALDDYYNADMENEKESAIIDAKKYSAQLALLEPFYNLDANKKESSQLPKLCALLGQESCQDNKEQTFLLTKIFRLINQLPTTGGR